MRRDLLRQLLERPQRVAHRALFTEPLNKRLNADAVWSHIEPSTQDQGFLPSPSRVPHDSGGNFAS